MTATGGTADEILVVGGGIGGLTAALALARAGLGVRVLERAAGFAELGAGLQLAPNATRVLRGLGVLDRVVEAGVLPRRLLLRSALTGDELTRLDVSDPFRRRYGAPYVVVHRTDLLDILASACATAGVGMQPATEVTAVTDHGGQVEVSCADGRRYRGAAVIGADGLHSVVRGALAGDPVVGSGFVAYRGTAAAERVARQVGPDEVAAWIGPGLHFVQYPLRGCAVYNQVAVFRSAQYAAGEQDWGTPDELDATFAACCPQVREAIPALWRDRRWPMYDREPMLAWVRGRVALLGDAAHPMLQYLAQGACQAIEDAGVLATALAQEAAGDGGGVPAALAGYQRVRASQAARVQRTSRLWGDIWHTDGVGALLRDELLRRQRPDDYRYTDWLYHPGDSHPVSNHPGDSHPVSSHPGHGRPQPAQEGRQPGARHR
jgi:salicylate hydroxylase